MTETISAVPIPTPSGCIALLDAADVLRAGTRRISCFHHRDKPGVHDIQIGGRPLSRWLANAPVGMQVDHINGDRLDNRMANLRICTHAENQMNRSKHKTNKIGFKGICRRQNGTYRAVIYVTKKQINLGHFSDLNQTVAAYDAAAMHYFGEFARPNHPRL